MNSWHSPDSGMSTNRRSSSSTSASVERFDESVDLSDTHPISPSTKRQRDLQPIRKRVPNACDFCRMKKAKCSVDRPCRACIISDKQCETLRADRSNPGRMVPEACPLFLKKPADQSDLKEIAIRADIRDWELYEIYQRMLIGRTYKPEKQGFAYFVEWLRIDPIISPPDIATQPRALRSHRYTPRQRRGQKFRARKSPAASMPNVLQDGPHPSIDVAPGGDFGLQPEMVASPTHDTPQAQKPHMLYAGTYMQHDQQPVSLPANDPSFPIQHSAPTLHPNFQEFDLNSGGDGGVHHPYPAQDFNYGNNYHDYNDINDGVNYPAQNQPTGNEFGGYVGPDYYQYHPQ